MTEGKMVRVSVIIPTHNRAGLLQEAIESVLAQDFTDYELIVVDDGSSDNTHQVIGPYAASLCYVYQENRGVSAARNRGISLAKGEFIAFLDSDDLWLKKKLSRQLAFFEANPFAQVCYTEEVWYRHGRRVNPKLKHRKYSGWIFEQSLPLCIVSPSSVMLRRETLDKVGLFDETLPVCEDYDMWLRLARDYPIYLIEEPLIIKRNGHPGQLTQQYWVLDRFRLQSLEKLLQNGLPPKHRRLVLDQIISRCRILAKGFFKRGKLAAGIYYTFKLYKCHSLQLNDLQ